MKTSPPKQPRPRATADDKAAAERARVWLHKLLTEGEFAESPEPPAPTPRHPTKQSRDV